MVCCLNAEHTIIGVNVVSTVRSRSALCILGKVFKPAILLNAEFVTKPLCVHWSDQRGGEAGSLGA